MLSIKIIDLLLVFRVLPFLADLFTADDSVCPPTELKGTITHLYSEGNDDRVYLEQITL